MGEANSKYVDVASAVIRVGGNEGLYRKLLEKFEKSVDITGFNDAIVGNDFIKAGEIVHAAKGIAGNLSLTNFFEESSVLMDQLRNGGTPNQDNVQSFKQSYADTLNSINAYLE
jgi:HPt (histidine-containing phosphotransfer) domain-containing protein